MGVFAEMHTVTRLHGKTSQGLSSSVGVDVCRENDTEGHVLSEENEWHSQLVYTAYKVVKSRLSQMVSKYRKGKQRLVLVASPSE